MTTSDNDFGCHTANVNDKVGRKGTFMENLHNFVKGSRLLEKKMGQEFIMQDTLYESVL